MLLTIEIEYCAVWHYTQRAAGLAAELLDSFEPEIRAISLVPSDGGRFEVKVNDELVYSKLATKRHVEPGEVTGLVHKLLERGK